MIDALIEKVQRLGLEGVFGRYYGVYLAVVEDTADPLNTGRLRLQVPSLGQRRAPAAIWARPAAFGGSKGTGVFYTPSVGDLVWVMFESGKPDKPVYLGGFMAEGAPSPDFSSPLRHGVKTAAGHMIRISDDDDKHITIRSASGAYASMTKDGDFVVAAKDGSYLNLSDDAATLHDKGGSLLTLKGGAATLVSADGACITIKDGVVTVLSASGVVLHAGGNITLKSGTVDIGSSAREGVVLGDSFAALYNAHTHPTPAGPSSPPVVPMLAGAHVSTSVKTS